MMSPAGRTCALLAVLLLSACGGLKSKGPVDQIYLLRPAPAAATPAAPVPGLLALRRPEVQPGLDTARIALVLPGNRLDYFASSRWSASLPQVIDAFAAQSMLASGQFELVNGGDRGAGGARFLVALTVRHFEADYAAGEQAAPTVHVAFECVVSSAASRAPLGRCDGEARVPAGENRMGPIVIAFEAAAREAMAEVSAQASRLAGEAASKPAAPAPAR
jgi:cholesterol transport system auxiliary component